MSSLFRPQATRAPTAAAMPFESYAQLVRSLIPSVDKICFYDAAARACWSSDGIEETDLRLHVDLALSRAREQADADEAHDTEQLTRVLPIMDTERRILGALALVLRHLPATTGYRRSGPLERMLAPLLVVLAHGWRQPQPAVDPSPPPRREPTPVTAPPVVPSVRASTAPALLRRAVSAVAGAVDCAFAALVATGRPIALTHRVRAQVSQVDLLSFVEALREPMVRLVGERSSVVATSSIDPPCVAGVSYKFATLPLRTQEGHLVALLALFRERREADFGPVEFVALSQVAAQIPAFVIDQLAPAPRAMPTPPAPRTEAATRVEPPSSPDSIANPPATSAASAVQAEPAGMEVKSAQRPLAERIRGALRADGFELYAQRISSLQDAAAPSRYEVLLRMSEETDLPEDFWHTAEAHGLLPEIDRWVIARLLKTLRGRGATGAAQAQFAVNVSAESLLRDSFGDYIESQLLRSGVPAQALLFELHESDAIRHASAAGQLATRLHRLGCGIAIDHCREGLDIFKTIQRWPVSCLKIDPTLTRGVTSDTHAEHVVREVVEVASDIGVATVGEHVEDEAIRAKLTELRIDFGQGFLLARPEPLANVLG